MFRLRSLCSPVSAARWAPSYGTVHPLDSEHLIVSVLMLAISESMNMYSLCIASIDIECHVVNMEN